MADYKVKLKAQENKVTCDSFEVTTGEYYQKLGYVELYEKIEEGEVDKWFAVFSYDKKEYESEISLDVDEESEIPVKGSFDIPVFVKEGYIKVGIYGYKVGEETLFDGTKKKVLTMVYSPEPCLCEIEKGSYPSKPQPSPNTYEKLNQEITLLKQGQQDYTAIKEWKDYIMNNEFIKGLRSIFKTQDATGTYVANHEDIYDLVSAYFGFMAGFEAGDYAEEILNRYFDVTFTQGTSSWTSNKTYQQIRAAIEEGKIPVALYVSSEDTNRALYNNIIDDDIVFTQFEIIEITGSTENKLKVVTFRIESNNQVYREEFNIGDIDPSKFELLSNKVQAISKTRQGHYAYPSEYAVVNYAEDKSNKTQTVDKTNPSQEKYTSENAVVTYAEDKSNKTQSVRRLEQSESLYPSEKAVFNYSEYLGNKKDTINKDAPTHDNYPSEIAVFSYSEDKSNKKTEVVETHGEEDYLTVNATKNYFEALNRKDSFITKGSYTEGHYPTTQAVAEYVNTYYTDKFKSGKVIRDQEGTEGEIVQTPDKETIYSIPAGEARDPFVVTGRLVNHDKIVSTSYPTEFYRPSIYSPTSATPVTIVIDQVDEDGNYKLTITVTGTLEADTPIIMQYFYYNIKYKYNLHFYKDEEMTEEQTEIKPIDLTSLGGGGGSGGGGTAFDEVKVALENEIYKLKFYKSGALITSISDGSLAKVQLNEATFNEAGTNLLLKNKSGDTLANAYFNFVTTDQMTTLKGLI